MYLYIIDGHKTKDRNPFLGDETSYISDGDPFGSTCSKKAGKLVEKMIQVFGVFHFLFNSFRVGSIQKK